MNNLKLGLFWPFRSSLTLDLSPTASIYYIHMLFEHFSSLAFLAFMAFMAFEVKSELKFYSYSINFYVNMLFSLFFPFLMLTFFGLHGLYWPFWSSLTLDLSPRASIYNVSVLF